MSVATTDLRALTLFEDCAPDDLVPVIDAVTATRTIGEGDVVCAEGDKADRWWIVADGLADVTVGGLYVATIGPGETIGELALLDGEPRAATVTAVTGMRLHEVDGDGFLDALQANPRLAVALARQLARRLRATNRRPVQPPAVRAAPSPTPVGVAPAAGFEPRTPGYHDDPTRHLGALREAAAVQWSDALSSYVVTRYDDVRRLSRDHSLLGSITTMNASDVPDATGVMAKHRPGHRMMIRRDGDAHLRLRRLMSKVFTPRAISRWQERAESIVARLLDAASERDAIDVIADYALPLPAQVITEMLGLPGDDTPQLRAWSRTLTTGLDPFASQADEDASMEAGRAIGEYLQQVVTDKRAAPGDDILGALLAAEDAGDVLDDNEVVAQVILLYVAGHETTLNLIGNGVTHLFAFPDQLERLRTDPTLDANAIEEVLRFDSPAQLTRRVCLQPLDLGGVTIEAGTHLTLSLASANHDPRKWGPTVDALDLARPGANEHVSFGGGAHYCLGASLARLEGAIALPRLVRRFPKMSPDYERPAWLKRVALRGVETLPVTLR